ncbi:MAG: TIGR01777 family protein [Lutibacter sp.]|nr:MAG: TIGR01777 family protein [Lutibacter sp.]
MTTILVTGGTGLIGKQVCKLLQNNGYSVLILSRTKSKNPSIYYWNIEKNYIDKQAILNANYIIHLAGAAIADKRWTKNRKLELINSRVKSTNLLFSYIKTFNPDLKGFISASAIGYYGAITSSKIFVEKDTHGKDFISTICKHWEKATHQFISIDIRTVIFRIGVVFSKRGGAFKKITIPIRFGIGTVLGNGKQYMPWIHIDDLCAMYLKAIEDTTITGTFNAVCPEHITNEQLTKTIVNALKKPLWLPNMPSSILRFIFGEMSTILLKGSRVSSKKIQETGFHFSYKKLTNLFN